MSAAPDRIDWPSIAGPVAHALLGDPNPRLSRQREYRYGQHGSLRIDLERGIWNDFEAGEGGGVLDLVMRECRCDTAGAMGWLEHQGFLNGRAPTCPAHETAAPTQLNRGEQDIERARLVAALWTAAVPADDSPARIYLARRWAWPPREIGSALPLSVRWLPRSNAPPRNKSARWYGVPRTAAGALVSAWTNHADAPPDAVSLEALRADGTRPNPRWRYTYGWRTGRAFVARTASTGAPVHIAEGEIDALALVHASWTGPGRIIAAGGTSGIHHAEALATGPVTIHADGDPGGRDAALSATEAIRAVGQTAQIVWYDGDPADAVAEWLRERSAMREHVGAELPKEANFGAWRDLLENRSAK